MATKLCIGHWPDRKRPILTMYEDGSNEHTTLAYFESDEAAEKFKELARDGIVWRGEMEREKK